MYVLRGTLPRTPSSKEMALEACNKAIEEVLRQATGTPTKPMRIQRRHVHSAIKSRKNERQIGEHRADKIWGWVATMTRSKHRLKNKVEWTQDWIGEEERAILEIRSEAAWRGVDPTTQPKVQKAEMIGSVMGWLLENEEESREGIYLVRAPKLKQLKDARKKMAAKRGGPLAIMAAIALLSAEGKATMEREPRKRAREGTDPKWVDSAVAWMLNETWITNQEAETLRMRAEATFKQHQKEQTRWYTVDMGEGWGSVRRAMQEWKGQDGKVEVIGVDRRGATNTGTKHGVITAAVQLDFAEHGDIMRRIEAKGGAAMSKWLLMWLSPECTLFSIVSVINQKKGAAHGRWAQTKQNRENAGAGRPEQEREQTREATKAVAHQIAELEKHPHVLFALENPCTSDLWELTKVKAALERNPTWRMLRVDQCAYGRRSQKPTYILTNVSNWTPQGRTGTGCCIIGECSGTEGNAPGARDHLEQTVANSKAKRVSQGSLMNGRRELTREAAVNSVQTELIHEILTAAEKMKVAARGKSEKRKRRCEGGLPTPKKA